LTSSPLGEAFSKGIPSQAVSSVPAPPFNAYGFSYGNCEAQVFDEDLVQDDDDESAVEICIQPDDVSSLGTSMMSLGELKLDPDGYKSDDNYLGTPSMNARKPENPSMKVPSYRQKGTQQRKLSSELSTVEEQSQSTESKVTDTSTAEAIMNLGNLPNESFLRTDSGGGYTSIGPLTVDEPDL
jgi:hypothetical protein